MAKNYSFERGKYGVTTGTIISFAILLDGDFPSESDWKKYVPAGYMRCKGQVLKAIDYLSLSSIIGIGSECIYKKENIELEEANDDLSLGEIQLPDLGSKHISAATAGGLYENLIVVDPNTGRELERSGLEVGLELNQGSAVEVFYSGNFVVPTIPLPFTSATNFVSDLVPLSDSATTGDYQYLAHGHYSNAVVTWRNGPLNTQNDGNNNGRVSTDSSPLDDTNQTADAGALVFPLIGLTTIGGSSASTQHAHQITKSAISKSITSNIDQVELEPFNVITTVNLTSRNIYKMDDLQHKFIIVEYLIKI